MANALPPTLSSPLPFPFPSPHQKRREEKRRGRPSTLVPDCPRASRASSPQSRPWRSRRSSIQDLPRGSSTGSPQLQVTAAADATGTLPSRRGSLTGAAARARLPRRQTHHQQGRSLLSGVRDAAGAPRRYCYT
nr:uncharacterized protein LOC109765149 [Aegilops tauschii subsp. strangulata]